MLDGAWIDHMGRDQASSLSCDKDIGQREGVMTEIFDRITVNPKQCGGRPCIRGMRIRVVDVLDLLASGLSAEEVLEELPDLQLADIQAALRFASQRVNHPILAA
jgi:uncharacterized protein (DUF433 family)